MDGSSMGIQEIPPFTLISVDSEPIWGEQSRCKLTNRPFQADVWFNNFEVESLRGIDIGMEAKIEKMIFGRLFSYACRIVSMNLVKFNGVKSHGRD